MKTHLYTKDRVACGELPDHSPMIRDPAAVDCERCRRTAIFKKIEANPETQTRNATIQARGVVLKCPTGY